MTANASAAKDASDQTVRFLTDRPRVKTVVLEWPFAIGDAEYREVVIRRLTTKEIDDFVSSLQGREGGAAVHLPMFYGVDDQPLPSSAWDAIDDDDKQKLFGVADDFLPARFKRTQTPEDGGSPSSSGPSTSDTGDKPSAASPAAA